MAEFMGAAYLRYSFTKGTEQEVAFLAGVLGLEAGQRVLDVGCGPGRHAHALARRGIEVVGVDLSPRFVELARAGAPAGATFECLDARRLPYESEFDAALSLCQGAFGLVPGEDGDVLAGIARALRSGGRLALSAFSSYFAVRFLEEGDTFDAGAGVNHEHTRVRNESGEEAGFDLWTSCFTPRELRLLAERTGLTPVELWSVAPGAYASDPPDLEHPELLLIALKNGT